MEGEEGEGEDHLFQRYRTYRGKAAVAEEAEEAEEEEEERNLLPGHRTSQDAERVRVAGDPIQTPVASMRMSQDWGLLEVVVPWRRASYAVALRMSYLRQRHHQPR